MRWRNEPNDKKQTKTVYSGTLAIENISIRVYIYIFGAVWSIFLNVDNCVLVSFEYVFVLIIEMEKTKSARKYMVHGHQYLLR